MKSNIVELRYIKHLVAKSLVLVASLATIAPNPANSAPPPTQVGKCADTFIQRISTRLGGSLTETRLKDSAVVSSSQMESTWCLMTILSNCELLVLKIR
jgi:hypothetical protein